MTALRELPTATAERSTRRWASVGPGPAVAVAAVAVALQIAYPLVAGGTRDVVTVAIVLLLAASAMAHAAATRGLRFAALLVAITALPGLAVELLGVHTGVPFGDYGYASSLGPRVAGVPVVVAFAWTMLAWPAALAARRLVRSLPARITLGAWALAVCDLFLDPQMVAAGHWTWSDPTPGLPGTSGVPLSDLGGWLLVSLLLSAGLQLALGRAAPVAASQDLLPVALYLWLFVGWTVALSGFLGLGAAAAWGALGMGTVAVPLAKRVVRRRG